MLYFVFKFRCIKRKRKWEIFSCAIHHKFQSANVEGWFTISTIKQVYHCTYALKCLHLVKWAHFLLNQSCNIKEESASYAFPFKSTFFIKLRNFLFILKSFLRHQIFIPKKLLTKVQAFETHINSQFKQFQDTILSVP